MNKYLEILNLFTSIDDKIRPHFNDPFKIEKRIYATNAHALCFFDSENIEGFVNKHDYSKFSPVTDIIPKGFNKDREILVSQLVKGLKLCPLIDEVETIENKIKCEECDGEGTVEYTYYGKKSTYERNIDCPECDGEGTLTLEEENKTGKKILDYTKGIIIGNSMFSCYLIENLIKTAKILNQDKVLLKYQDTKSKCSMFRVLDVYILLMPLMRENDDNVVFNIA